MEKSQTIKELATALASFQSEVNAVKKDGNNPFFKSKYATLENIIETVREPLKKHELSFSQFPSGVNGLTTILMHNSGEYLQSTITMTPKDNTPQGQGSAITYMRRYALSSILGIATEEDDDGNAASKPKAVEAPKAAIPLKKLTVKNQILNKLKILTNIPIGKDNVNQIVLDLTQLELIEGNFEEINTRLEVLINEKHNG